MNVITLPLVQALEDQFQGPGFPEGLKVTCHTDTWDDGEPDTWEIYRLPKAGPFRCFTDRQLSQGVVVPINGRRYKVLLSLRDTECGCEGGSVTFIPTEEPETPYQPWSEEKAREEDLQYQQKSLNRAQKELESYSSGKKTPRDPEILRWLRDDIRCCTRQIQQIHDGDAQYHPSADVNFFGHPYFIQGTPINAYEGRCAMNLVTLETGWGDAGNVNILFACDEQGVPCRVWCEASCC